MAFNGVQVAAFLRVSGLSLGLRGSFVCLWLRGCKLLDASRDAHGFDLRVAGFMCLCSWSSLGFYRVGMVASVDSFIFPS